MKKNARKYIGTDKEKSIFAGNSFKVQNVRDRFYKK